MQKYVWIAIGGSLGALTRVWVGSTVAGKMGAKFPYGTLVINVSACIIIGFSLAFLDSHLEINPMWRYLVPTGFVGAYSTFSTFEWEVFSNLQIGGMMIAGSYLAISIILGLAGIWCGVLLARTIA